MKKFTKIKQVIKNNLLAAGLILSSIQIASAQTIQWISPSGSSNNDEGKKTCTDGAGNIYVAGEFSGFNMAIGSTTLMGMGGGSDIYVAKYNSSGTALWAQRIASSGLDKVGGITCDPSGDIYLTGYFDGGSISSGTFNITNSNAGTKDIFLVSISQTGNTNWLKVYGGMNNDWGSDCGFSVAQNCVYITGYFLSSFIPMNTVTIMNSGFSFDGYLAKINTSGNAVWGINVGNSTADEKVSCLNADVNGDVFIGGVYIPQTTTAVVGGSTLTTNGFQDIFVAKYDQTGNGIWGMGAGTSSPNDTITSVGSDGAGNVIAAGSYTNLTMSFGATSNLPGTTPANSYIVKYGPLGVLQYANSIGGNMRANCLSVDGNNDIYIAANSSGGDAIVLKYSSAGVQQYTTSATGTGTETGSGICADALGNIYFTGAYGPATATFGTFTVSSTGASDAYLAKIGCLSDMISISSSTICNGSSSTLTAMGGASSYTWSTGAITSSIVVSPSITTTYSVLGSSGACIGNGKSVTLTVLPASLNVGPNLNLLCKQTQVINASTNPLATTVVWTPTTNLSSGSVISPTVIAGSSPITYTLNVQLANGCALTKTLNVKSYAPTPDICQVTVDSLGNNNEIYWEKTLYPQADSFIVYREVSANTYSRIAAVSRTAFSMYTDTNRTIGPFNGDPNLTYYRYKLAIKDSCGNLSPLSKWHETIFVQDQINGNFNWNSYAIESSTSPVTSYNLKRRTIATGTETLVVSTGGNLATDPNYNTLWPTNIKWFVDAVGFNCTPSIVKNPKNGIEIAVVKTKTKSNQSNDRLMMTGVSGKDQSELVKIYPNPATHIINIDLNMLAKSEMSIEIQNVLGQTIYQVNSQNQFLVVNSGEFAEGVYFVNVKQNEKKVAVKRVVVYR